MRATTGAIFALLAAAALTLTGCVGVESEVPAAAPEDSATSEVCAGVETVVDFGELGGAPETGCAETDAAITAAEAFQQAGVELEGVAASDQFFACRVAGAPAADQELEYEGEGYTADCAGFGPAWAWWGLFVDTGEGWAFAQEGAETQQVEPGQRVAFAWQFGDTTEPRLPVDQS
ncbi:hypothetical protein ACFPZL_08815 [Leucobacter soli]|uniref:DUF4430 domain-containing protein n=1 Tax=Leucobacter soli TaxID=2812850 RepID=A0A916JWG0_9MICO|nr:hypothetical protein [Leucobacter soli]CAG7610076.1 hypothetical protein LEUCIP111803_01258 [Leucobacter soli]